MLVKEIKEALVKELVGQDADSYKVTDVWYKCVKKLFEKAGLDTRKIIYNAERFEITFYYKGDESTNAYANRKAFLRVQCKRAKGRTHNQFGIFNYTEYTWKDFVVEGINEKGWFEPNLELNVIDSYKYAIGYFNKAMEKTNAEFNKLSAIYNKIFADMPDLSSWDRYDLIKKLYNEKYNLDRAFEKTLKND